LSPWPSPWWLDCPDELPPFDDVEGVLEEDADTDCTLRAGRAPVVVDAAAKGVAAGLELLALPDDAGAM
jgi:hypothetical protein